MGTINSSISNITGLIKSALELPKTPMSPLPPPLIIIGGNIRPGLSARTITSRVISRQAEAGAPSGDIFSEQSNVMESMINIIVEEVIEAIVLEAKIEVAIPPGIQVLSQGANAGGPVVSQGLTTSIASGTAIIR